MSSVSVLYTKYFGEIIGEVSENLDSTLSVTNPERVHHTPEGTMLMDVLVMSNKNKLVLHKDDLATEPHTAIDEVAKQYNEKYGKIHVPQKKLIIE